jgi:hypothetical protein
MRSLQANVSITSATAVTLPRSRPGCRFELTSVGRAIHGTVKWQDVNAIALARKTLAALEDLIVKPFDDLRMAKNC